MHKERVATTLTMDSPFMVPPRILDAEIIQCVVSLVPSEGGCIRDHAYGLVLGLFCPTGHQVVSALGSSFKKRLKVALFDFSLRQIELQRTLPYSASSALSLSPYVLYSPSAFT